MLTKEDVAAAADAIPDFVDAQPAQAILNALASIPEEDFAKVAVLMEKARLALEPHCAKCKRFIYKVGIELPDERICDWCKESA